jgi:two-component system, NarL family, invasion response regulator UvrY
MLKILIADDHPIFRRGLKQIISENNDMMVAGEAANGLEALDMVRSASYDVILLDITMPGKDGIDVLSRLKKDMPGLPVLMLSMHPEEQYAIRALALGASGYLTKESASDELVTAIRKVSAHGKYVSSSLAERLAGYLELTRGKPLHETLSNREFKVMRMIASGKTATEIARELSLSVKTISTHRSRLLRKMGMKNNAELTHYSIANHLVE